VISRHHADAGRITIVPVDDILEHFRSSAKAAGIGYQTMLYAALRESNAKPKGRTAADRRRPAF